ncbi:hypothetical protein PUN28_016799 [Cardiocondyla obscurior]
MARLSYIVTIISMALVYVLAEDLYSDQYDYVDATSIVQNDKLREQYVKCYMETGPCVTADAKFFKDIFSEAVQTNCRRCTEKQKEKLDYIVDWFTKNKPEQWQAMIAKSLEELKKKNAG